ncbi:hypothetical protein RGF97_02905 [Streptomyces roseicoloratus]|uniref:Uncharacterized protein n=1 Tax=Streptomyces roseicoloratus TaxID=2508722 RepID=A0ABY9RPA2_9ACTN|nr:hypothetical protein [Streptomyces roseicoloratus]WMX44020.1 hypothetical protein RGF97_02905 [Streptomyces roseicoloratus]
MTPVGLPTGIVQGGDVHRFITFITFFAFFAFFAFVARWSVAGRQGGGAAGDGVMG